MAQCGLFSGPSYPQIRPVPIYSYGIEKWSFWSRKFGEKRWMFLIDWELLVFVRARKRYHGDQFWRASRFTRVFLSILHSISVPLSCRYNIDTLIIDHLFRPSFLHTFETIFKFRYPRFENSPHFSNNDKLRMARIRWFHLWCRYSWELSARCWPIYSKGRSKLFIHRIHLTFQELYREYSVQLNAQKFFKLCVSFIATWHSLFVLLRYRWSIDLLVISSLIFFMWSTVDCSHLSNILWW